MKWARITEGVRVEAEFAQRAVERVAQAMYQWFRGGGRGFSQDEWMLLEPLEREAAIIAHERYRGETMGVQALAIKDPGPGQEGHRGIAERLEKMGNLTPETKAREAIAQELGIDPATLGRGEEKAP